MDDMIPTNIAIIMVNSYYQRVVAMRRWSTIKHTGF